jgi:hypothetical protein
MTMTEFRSRQPLSDDDFAAIRRNVMTTITARRRFFPIAMRFAIAAVVLIAIGLGSVARRPARPAMIAVRKPLLVKAPATVASITPPPSVARVAARHPRHRRAIHRRAGYAAVTQADIRVEFRTSDPDVRIIWIASQTPSTTTGGKS